jgi:glycosyltransferase involved in cell wall biosynthesis
MHRTSPGQRYRIQAWREHLGRSGIDTVEAPFATPELQRALQEGGPLRRRLYAAGRSLRSYRDRLPAPKAFDAVLVYREATPLPYRFERRALNGSLPPVVFDIDDPIFLPSEGSSRATRFLNNADKTKRWCETASLVICINEPIAEVVRPWSSRTLVMPNAIDLKKYPLPDRSPGGERLILGFSGSRTTTSQLLEIETALDRFARTRRFELHVTGGRSSIRGKRYPIREVRWSPEAEWSILGSFDIALAPAFDTPWNHFKEFLKVVQYMAAGLPVVASPVGSSTRLIRDRKNGFLASSPQEWVDALDALAGDRELRMRIGLEARRTVEREYSLDVHLPRLVRALEDTIGHDVR